MFRANVVMHDYNSSASVTADSLKSEVQQQPPGSSLQETEQLPELLKADEVELSEQGNTAGKCQAGAKFAAETREPALDGAAWLAAVDHSADKVSDMISNSTDVLQLSEASEDLRPGVSAPLPSVEEAISSIGPDAAPYLCGQPGKPPENDANIHGQQGSIIAAMSMSEAFKIPATEPGDCSLTQDKAAPFSGLLPQYSVPDLKEDVGVSRPIWEFA